MSKNLPDVLWAFTRSRRLLSEDLAPLLWTHCNTIRREGVARVTIHFYGIVCAKYVHNDEIAHK